MLGKGERGGSRLLTGESRPPRLDRRRRPPRHGMARPTGRRGRGARAGDGSPGVSRRRLVATRRAVDRGAVQPPAGALSRQSRPVRSGPRSRSVVSVCPDGAPPSRVSPATRWSGPAVAIGIATTSPSRFSGEPATPPVGRRETTDGRVGSSLDVSGRRVLVTRPRRGCAAPCLRPRQRHGLSCPRVR